MLPMRCGLRREYHRGVAAHVAGDYVGALRVFRHLARSGFAPARFMLASMHHKGEGVEADPDEALLHYLVAAGRGEPRSAFMVGCMHCVGEAVEEDPGAAVRWFRLSADRGYAPAQFSLGTMYSSGTDVARDPHEAKKWLFLAAAQGHRQALLDLQAVATFMKQEQPNDSSGVPLDGVVPGTRGRAK